MKSQSIKHKILELSQIVYVTVEYNSQHITDNCPS